jgi:hypothetical protein
MTIEWTPIINDEDNERQVECGVCDWEGEIEDTMPLAHFHKRLCAGAEVPVGECPECEHYAYFKKTIEEYSDYE